MRAAEEEEARLTEEARRLIEQAEMERAKAEELLASEGAPARPAAEPSQTVAAEPERAKPTDDEQLARQRAEDARRLAEKLSRVRQLREIPRGRKSRPRYGGEGGRWSSAGCASARGCPAVPASQIRGISAARNPARRSGRDAAPAPVEAAAPAVAVAPPPAEAPPATATVTPAPTPPQADPPSHKPEAVAAAPLPANPAPPAIEVPASAPPPRPPNPGCRNRRRTWPPRPSPYPRRQLRPPPRSSPPSAATPRA